MVSCCHGVIAALRYDLTQVKLLLDTAKKVVASLQDVVTSGALISKEVGTVPEFETFTRRMIPLVKKPSITIQKRGTMSFNKAAYVALGSPEAVELLYDKELKIVGIRAIDPIVDHAYPMRPQANKDDGPYIVSGAAFTKYYGIDTEEARRWNAELEDGILCIDLRQPGQVVTSNRSGSGRLNGEGAAPDEISGSEPPVSR